MPHHHYGDEDYLKNELRLEPVKFRCFILSNSPYL